MALLPGVPNVGPAPVSPTVKSSPSGGLGHARGIAAVAASVGKPGKTEHLGTVVGRTGKGLTNVGGGDSALHSLNHYGKAGKSPALLGGSQGAGGVDPTAHDGAKMIRGGSGAMKRNVRQGGLGPGFAGTPGPSDTNYSMQSEDTE